MFLPDLPHAEPGASAHRCSGFPKTGRNEPFAPQLQALHLVHGADGHGGDEGLLGEGTGAHHVDLAGEVLVVGTKQVGFIVD